MPAYKIKTFGWRPDLPDARDKAYKLERPRAALPLNVDLRDKCPPVVDQGQLGSCTANAIAGNIDYLKIHPKKKLHPSSRLFLYYEERDMEGTVKEDAGAYLRDGMKVAKNIGVPWESTFPYNIAKFAKKPTKSAFTSAATKKINSYHPLDTVEEMQGCLADGFPFVFGFSVYENFESANTAQSGMVNMPTPNENLLGGHAVMAVGYDMTANQFIVRNSWGVDWGMQGYFTMPSDYLADRNLSDDFWSIR